MEPEELFTLLSDSTRLRSMALLATEGELCVCELTEALELSQPKISRHLALLRESGLVQTRREGTWMHYRISESIPAWARSVLKASLAEIRGLERFRRDRDLLHAMDGRPGVRACG